MAYLQILLKVQVTVILMNISVQLSTNMEQVYKSSYPNKIDEVYTYLQREGHVRAEECDTLSTKEMKQVNRCAISCYSKMKVGARSPV